ncbi:hypothetical protein QFZ87_003642 [Bacillus sp. SLBN-46]|uniref:hypothetical protein n=1 Tax=Bacillus sp. SLBN-46 TaxID=3042283 RepID=UPI002858AB23|nr:hypothetical protein [Bacillus sp. SLBN-46]MDR6124045.1 hypothetical protein [Bacillus sp. SLBN-46]
MESLVGKTFRKLTVISQEKIDGKTFCFCQCECGNPELKKAIPSELKRGKLKSCGCNKKMKDLVGQRFGTWLVLGLDKDNSTTEVKKWFCKCDCGTKDSVWGNSLKSGASKSCGCANRLNLVGKKYNLLTVVSQETIEGRTYCWCRCDCGNPELHRVAANNIQRDEVKSCGCLRIGEDLTGKRFGKLLVIGRDVEGSEPNRKRWFCKCDCGTEKSILRGSLVSESIKSCGCSQFENRYRLDLIGQKFNMLTVQSQEVINGRTFCYCICDCGNSDIALVPGTSLKMETVKSCGCLNALDDLTGRTYGNLTVLGLDVDKSNSKHKKWFCECECGKQVSIWGDSLKNGRSKTCGCSVQKKVIDLTGQVFTYLTVIKRNFEHQARRISGGPSWDCICRCGKTVTARSGELKAQTTISCGCYRGTEAEKMLLGRKFGRLTVLKRLRGLNGEKIRLQCLCECGNIAVSNISSVIRGDTKSCGCYQDEVRRERRGSKHPNWTGLTPLKLYLRNQIEDWKSASIEAWNYRCGISGEKFDEVHHIYPFASIVQEVIRVMELTIYEEIGSYTDEELILLCEVNEKLHFQYGLGIPLKGELHTEFHTTYSNKNFSPEDFYEFYEKKTGVPFQPKLVENYWA